MQGHMDADHTDCLLDGILQRQERGEVDSNGRPLFTDSNLAVIVQDITIAGK